MKDNHILGTKNLNSCSYEMDCQNRPIALKFFQNSVKSFNGGSVVVPCPTKMLESWSWFFEHERCAVGIVQFSLAVRD